MLDSDINVPTPFQIRVENSAPSQKQPAKSVQWAAPLLKKLGVSKVAEFGCGLLRNVPVLTQFFRDVTLVETPSQCKRISATVAQRQDVRLQTSAEFEAEQSRYDAIFLIAVLHIIPHIDDRRAVLKIVWTKLKQHGYLVIDVPSSETYYRRLNGKKPTFLDGMLRGDGRYRTFYKNYNAKELDQFVESTISVKKVDWNRQEKHVTRIFARGTNKD